jgi:phytoene dehydrogenase-like protein
VSTRRAVVIGAGPNGLTTAFYLAKAGLRPLVLERREVVGGSAVTSDLHAGFRVPTLSHAIGPVRAAVARDMGLASLGVELLQPAVASLTPGEGRALVLARDPWQSARYLTAVSERDASRYADFQLAVGRGGRLIGELMDEAPPSLERPAPGEVWALLKRGRRFRALGRSEAYRLLRWGPMAVADLAADWFETETLRATVAARGIVGANLGVRSAGSAAVLLLEAARQPEAPGAPCFVRGGIGTLTAAMAVAASQAGAEIRRGAEVSRLEISDAGVDRVVLAGGEEIAASLVVSNADPKRTLLGLVDPVRLDPGVLQRLRNYRSRGTVAKVNLALGGLPAFEKVGRLPEGVALEQALSGRLHVAPNLDYLERAFDASKYGTWARRPYLECTFPSLTDPGLAPPGRHVLSVYVQYAPWALRDRTWAEAREALTRDVLETLAQYSPDLPSLVLASQTITPADLEHEYGYTGGHIHHGEMALDQLYVMRPLLGWAQYRTPIRGLYLCGAGTHPGGGITGANGANAARIVLKDLRQRRS